MQALTLVLARPAEVERTFEQFLADQQNPSSPEYHHWLTPAEVGERFGLSDSDIASITGWLQAEGLQVDWIAPSKVFVGFSGTAADISHAFQTEVRNYRVNGEARISVSSDPMIPAAFGSAIRAIHGLYTVEERPQHLATSVESATPQISTSGGNNFIGPHDFDKIYDIPPLADGAGETIAIVGRSRTNFADFDNFKALTQVDFVDPTEVVPTTYGGVDPGPAYTTPPVAGYSIADQGEATLDVLRAASVARRAHLLLVVATSASGGIEADAQYVVNTAPVPAQVMTISFGACESQAGPAGVSFWDTLFQQAAAEGISSFVSSGDSGASGCDLAFQPPPAHPIANSPNYICSSSYATCVGGTEFNDFADPSPYWTPSAGLYGSAVGYIPEGGWNESWDGITSTVAASGGGSSAYVATPSWQIGVAGVPAANTGRYTPDVSFSSSGHDGYFACFAAGGGSCVVSEGTFHFVVFAGTSAASPAMAGISALLNQYLSAAQGNLNPGIYQMSVSAPTAFHDVTLASSGLTSCDLTTPSLCNNSIPGPAGLSGGQAGYAVGTGYDQVTGLGSLDVSTFIDAYQTASKIMTPIVSVSTPGTLPANQPLIIGVGVSRGNYSPIPTGSVVATVGSYTSEATPLTYGAAKIQAAVGTLPVGDYTVSATYTPDSASAAIYSSASGSQPLSVIVPPKVKPSLTLTPSPQIITNSLAVAVSVVVNAVQYYLTPTGSVTLTSKTYTSAPVTLTSGSATITVPAGMLAAGNDYLTVTYTPDAASSSSYLSNSNDTSVQNEGATITPSVSLTADPVNPTTTQAFTMSVRVDGFSGNPTPTGAIVVASTGYSSSPTPLSNGVALINIAAGALPAGVDKLVATYTPDPQSSGLFSSATGTTQIGITLAQKITPVVTFTVNSSPTIAQPLSLSITVNGGAGHPAPSGQLQVRGGNFGNVYETLSGGAASVTIPAAALSMGDNTITAQYDPDSDASFIYNQQSATTTVTATKATPTVTATAQPSSAATTSAIAVTVTVSGGTGALNATGAVTLSNGTYSLGGSDLSQGTGTITVAPGMLFPGSDTLTAKYLGDTNYNSTSGTGTVIVTEPADANFTITGGSATVIKGSSTNTGIVITPISGFVGTVSLAATITSQPAGAQFLPTMTFSSTSPVNVTGFVGAAATLSISTAPATTGALTYPARPGNRWYPAGGALLACFLLFLAPLRWRAKNVTGMLLLLVALAAGVTSCSGGGGQSGGGTGGTSGGGGNSGTTSGQYTITVTGTSGATTATNTITLTVQ